MPELKWRDLSLVAVVEGRCSADGAGGASAEELRRAAAVEVMPTVQPAKVVPDDVVLQADVAARLLAGELPRKRNRGQPHDAGDALDACAMLGLRRREASSFLKRDERCFEAAQPLLGQAQA